MERVGIDILMFKFYSIWMVVIFKVKGVFVFI